MRRWLHLLKTYKMLSIILRASFSLSEAGAKAGTADTIYTGRRRSRVSPATLQRRGAHLGPEETQLARLFLCGSSLG